MSTLSKFKRERIVISTGKLVEGWCDDLWKDDAYDDKNNQRIMQDDEGEAYVVRSLKFGFFIG